MVLVLTCALGAFSLGQENETTPSESNSNTDLPENAVWRFGNHGKGVGYNGYYLTVFSPNGKLLLARDAPNHFRLFDVPSRQLLFEFESYKDLGTIKSLDFSPNSEFFLVGSEGVRNQVTVWNAKTGKLHSKLDTDAKLAFFASNNEIVVMKQRKILYYDVNSGKLVRSAPWGNAGDVPHSFSRSGHVILAQRRSQKNAHTTQVVDLVKKTTTIFTDCPTMMIRAATFSPNGNWMVAKFARQNEAYLWDLRDPHKKIDNKLVAHTETLHALCFSPDNRFLATTGWDREIYIWDVLSRETIGKLSGHGGNIAACGFSPNDFMLATGATGEDDNSIILWDYENLVFPKNDVANNLEFGELWKALASDNHRTALDAVSFLVSHPEKFRQPLSQKLGVAAAGASVEQIQAWIAQLSSRQFAMRTEAENQLKKARMRAEQILKATLERDDIVLEVKYRVQRILTQPVERPEIPQPELHRLHRTIYAMELIGSPRSAEMLQNIADAHSHIDIARDAANSLRRIQMRDSLSDADED